MAGQFLTYNSKKLSDSTKNRPRNGLCVNWENQFQMKLDQKK